MINRLGITLPLARTIEAGGRWYVTSDMKFYTSVTTFLDKAMPMDPGLKDWQKKNTEEDINQVLDDSSEYGTLWHEYCERFDSDGYFSTDNIPSVSRKYNSELMIKHVASYIYFLRDRYVKVLCSEVTLVDPSIGLAGTVDKIVEMKFGSKMVRAMVDLKSGEGDWAAHKYQLGIYRLMWNNLYPEFPIHYIFNLHPVNYQKEPSYKLINQSDVCMDDVKDYLSIFSRSGKNRPPDKKLFKKKIQLNDDLTNLFWTVSPEEYYTYLFTDGRTDT